MAFSFNIYVGISVIKERYGDNNKRPSFIEVTGLRGVYIIRKRLH